MIVQIANLKQSVTMFLIAGNIESAINIAKNGLIYIPDSGLFYYYCFKLKIDSRSPIKNYFVNQLRFCVVLS